MSKKRIIAIITIIVLLFAAGISVGVFLYGRAETEATGQSQTTDKNQVTDGNQDGENSTQNIQNNGDDVEGSVSNETVENDNQNANTQEVNNQNINNNNVTNNTNNVGVTTNTNVDNVGETTISRVEEKERLISEDFLDWWQPMTVSVNPTEVGVELPQITVKKSAITGVGEDKFVYIGQDITYVIAVTNNSEIAVEDIEVTDRIPKNTTYVADSIEDAVILRKVDGELTSEIVGTKSTVEVENKVVGVKWIVSIPAGETVIAKFTVNVNKTMLDANNAEVETTGIILNHAIANGEESNEVETSIIRTHKSSVITRNDEIVETAKIGDLITYTISIENTGDVEGTTYIMDEVPEGTKFVSAQQEVTISEDKDAMAWIVTVPAHTTITREFTVEVTSVEGIIKNIATVGGTPTNEDIIDTANIEVIKTATAVKRDGENEFTTPVGKVKENDVIQYTIVVTNTGSRDLTNVLLEEQLEGVEVTKLVVDNIEKSIEKDATTGNLIIGKLKAAKEATEENEAVEAGVAVITAEYTVSYDLEMNTSNEGYKDGTLEFVYNKVRATGETIPKTPDEVPEEVEDNDDETVLVISDPNFTVEKTAVQVKKVGENGFVDLTGKVRTGDIVKYEIVITNTGNIKLTNIEVRDTLDVRVDEYDETKETIKAGEVIKVIPCLVSGESATIITYYEVNEDDITLGEVNEVIKNIVTAKPEELEEKDDDEIIYVNPNTEVVGTKNWDDNNNQDGKRPERITIRLLANGREVQNKVVTVNDNWSWEFEKLPVYDGENKITYTILEDNVTEYTTNIVGYNVTNIHVPETTVIEGSKTWDDNNNQDGKRPESITIRLLADGNEVQNKVVTASENWSWSFENLPVYENGKKLEYTITEDVIVEYTTTIDGYNVINKHVPETILIEGSKTWGDNNNQDGKRPERITIRLLADGKEIQNKVVTVNDNWSWSFGELPVYENGKKLEYTITEDVVAEYTTTIDGFNITNKHIPETTKVEGIKTWADNNNQDGKRPESITIRLLADGKEIQNKVVTSENNWSWSFENLPVYENGKKLEYTITEDAVAEYTTIIDGYNVTNTHIPETTEVNGNKTWADNNNQDGKRPERIIIRLLANKEQVTYIQVTANENWSWSFKNLPVYEDGEKLEYTITEDDVSDYTTKVDGYNIINTHIPETTDIRGTKTWDDNNNQDGKRPGRITIRLLADGKEIQNKVVTSENNWSWSFENLPVYENGKKLEYTIVEDVVAEYTTKVDGYNVTNIHIPETTVINGTKTWLDNNNKEGKRPESIIIRLLAEGKEIQNKVVTSEDNWSWEFEKLPVYKSGTKIQYTITEDQVAGYETPQVNGFNVTNTILQQNTVDISGTKTWYVPDGYEVPDITIRLYQNGIPFKKSNGEDLIFVIENGAETYQFKGLPKYKTENGKYVIDANGNFTENVYTVSEDAITGFKSEQKGYDFINIRQEKTSISGIKIWDDNNNQDGKRPSTIIINLWADGVKLNNKPEISKAQDAQGKWTYTFYDLEKYSNLGKEITYTVTEETVPGYEILKIDGYDIINKHIPETTTIKGTKTWHDGANKYEKRPKSITVNLLADGTKVDSKTISPDSKGIWPAYEFKNKPVYSNGKKINYTITENPVDGYTSSTNGYNLINTYKEPTGTITRNWDITSTTASPIPVDVVFVLDTSYSMVQVKDGIPNTRGADLVDAVNSAIKEILSFNSYNRVSVVGFSEDGMYGDGHNNRTDASILLSLGRYEVKDKSNKKSYLVKDGDKVTTNVTSYTKQKTRYFEQGTYTQAGIKLGAEQLTNVKDTTVKINDKTTVKRIPMIILVSDGEPTAFTTSFKNPQINIEQYEKVDGKWDVTKYNKNKLGTGQLKNNSAIYGYYTILTANYYKKQVTSHYGTSAKMFTIAMDLTTYYGETVLNPGNTQLNTCKTHVEADKKNGLINQIENRKIAQDLYKYLNYTKNTDVKYSELQKDSKGNVKTDDNGIMYKQKTITLNYANESPYRGDYADKAFKGHMDAETLKKAMIGSITETTAASKTWGLSEITAEEKLNCRANLPNIDINGTFRILVKVGNTTVMDYKTFNSAFTGTEKVIKGNSTSGYYLDLKAIPAGATVTITYRQK